MAPKLSLIGYWQFEDFHETLDSKELLLARLLSHRGRLQRWSFPISSTELAYQRETLKNARRNIVDSYTSVNLFSSRRLALRVLRGA